MKPKLIIHIGTHKTATSTLQHLMSTNRDKMAEQGLHYARTDRLPMPKNHKHAFFGRVMKSGPEAFRVLKDRMLRELEASGCHTIVVSEEGLAGPKLAHRVSAMKIFAEDFDIRAICMLRRQDSFAESFWNYRCKSGVETRQIADYVQWDHIRAYMDYPTILNHWAAFGEVTALGFETAREKGLIESFTQALGITLPLETRDRNISPSMTVAAILAVFNRERFGARWENIVPMLEPEEVRKTALGSVLRQRLLDDYAEANRKLAEAYGVTFPDTMPAEEAEPIGEPDPALVRRVKEVLVAHHRVRRRKRQAG